MKKPRTVKSLEELGRVRLSTNFFMRDFLHSEISQMEGIPNIPDFPDIAIKAGTELCVKVLEPIQSEFGRISIRSAYRSPAVNARGAENKNQYNCSRNEANYAGHIWDYRDSEGHMGATACIVVNSFLPYYERTGHWQALAWWIHDHVPEYSSMCFFPKLAAFNISWHEKPEKLINSYISGSRGILTKFGWDNFGGSHEEEYFDMLNEIA
ncbi:MULTISPECIES: peptidase M15 [Vibrio]|uniref:peptidase M15 n=1 Tax=Vibrio TaxID=662 RepID=UPI00080383A4|nr:MULTISPECIES: peptidase M15 [Vibrio]ANP67163.1 peptidase M15 [Vibrio alginolyticus]MCF7454836.1 peptidase M15 [Vibrio sp. A1-1]